MTDIKAEALSIAQEHRFSFDEEGDGFLLFSTRDNGDVANGEAGQADIGRAIDMRDDLEELKNVKVSIDIVDEWVMITVKY